MTSLAKNKHRANAATPGILHASPSPSLSLHGGCLASFLPHQEFSRLPETPPPDTPPIFPPPPYPPPSLFPPSPSLSLHGLTLTRAADEEGEPVEERVGHQLGVSTHEAPTHLACLTLTTHLCS
ncbi:unnamed protein product [Closterium sp. NIES-53]